jgi:2,3-bisphosphoglycerate-independent phosphoglycerate mutase
VSAAPRSVLFVFVDGVGIGEPDPATNAFVHAHLPHLRGLLGGRLPLRDALDADGRITGGAGALAAADATLGVPGRPQSGTGQTALLTGENAAALFGRHFGSWVPTTLRPMLAERSILARAQRAGRRAAFANAHPPGFGVERRPSAPALAAHAAGLLTRGPAELARGAAVASSITNERWLEHLPDAGFPSVGPAEAGAALVRIAAEAEVTLFAHYDTDFVGHRSSLADAVTALERVDAFLGGIFGALPEGMLLLVGSDHGNVEDASTGHTLNPVPVIAAGPGADRLVARVRSVTDVVPALCELLGIDPDTPTPR